MRNFLAFFGHVAIDVTMRVDHLPTHGSVGIDRYDENYGGTAGNFALVASKLDFPFHLFSAVSSKTHKNYLRLLEDRGVDTSHIVIDDNDHGPIGYAVTTGSEQIYYFYQGPMQNPLYGRIKLDSGDYQYVHFGTGLPSDYLKISEKLEGSRVVFDPGQEITYRYDSEHLSPLLRKASIAMFNESEAKHASRLLGIGREELPDRCDHLIVTRGSRGSSYYHDGEKQDFAAVKVTDPYDTIGAGDAFRAGLYFALNRGMDIQQGIAMGSIVSAEAIKQPFANFSMTAENLLAIYEKERNSLFL